MPCRFSWIRAARRSRAAYQKEVKMTADNYQIKKPCLVLDTTSFHLVTENFRAGLLGLGLVDVFHQHTFILEDVTLGFLIQGVIPGPAP